MYFENKAAAEHEFPWYERKFRHKAFNAKETVDGHSHNHIESILRRHEPLSETCFRLMKLLYSVTSSSPVPVLWYRYDYDCHYHLSYDVTRRSGLRDPLTTQPSARASNETLLWLPCKNYYNYLLPLKCCIRYSSTAVPILGKVLVTLF